MPRKYIRKTNRGVSQEIMDKAVATIMDTNCSVRSAAIKFGIKKVTLHVYYKKIIDPKMSQPPRVGYRSSNRVFSEDQEKELEDYIIMASEIYLGLNTYEVRKIAYQIANLKSLKIPETWVKNEVAGIDWYKSFMKRHPRLSLRKAQATSLSRATSFNKSNVDFFFENLRKVFERDNFEPQSIYNVDETGITTVHQPNRIVAKRGAHQVGALTSGERGTLITMALAVNAIGNSIPPHFIFPRIRYKDHFLHGAPVGSIGSGNKSGWMQEKEFLVFIHHFAKYSKATKQNKVLLLLDNHESHVSVPVIDFCRQNGIILLSFPPHCSHKLQPLDRSVYGPLKKHFNKLASSWMKQHPGKPMTIYDIPSLVKEALISALSISNITNGFKCTGICPFNANIFGKEDFSPSYVTDRPQTFQTVQSEALASTSDGQPDPIMEPTNEQIDKQMESSTLDLENNFPFAKAEPRKIAKNARKRRKSAILTDTPERNAIEAQKLATLARKSTKKPKFSKDKNQNTPKKKAAKKCPRKI